MDRNFRLIFGQYSGINSTSIKEYKLDNKTLKIFSCHHKVGTSWFSKILSDVCRTYGLKFVYKQELSIDGSPDFIFDDHSRIMSLDLPTYLGVHLIRDPRDVIVSGYHYHKWTEENWANQVSPKYGNMSYKQKLNSFDNEVEAFSFELNHIGSETISEMMQWDYDNPAYLEVKYEDLLANERDVFYKIFEHYGFGDDVHKCVEIAQKYNFNNLKGTFGKHLRKGQSGDWKNHFSEDLKEEFKDKFPGVLEKLGYESDSNW